jgi:HAD superfamily hydrolase (TIGR01490 family)
MTVKIKKRKVAFFDLDGTVFRGSLVGELVKELILMRYFSSDSGLKINEAHQKHKNRQISYTDYLNVIIEEYRHNLKSCTIDHFNQASDEVMRKKSDRVYTYTRDLINQYKQERYFLVAISGSLDIIVSKFADNMGFNLSFGAGLESVNGKFTGKHLNKNCYEDKSKVVQSFINKADFEVDLANSIAVGDTSADISMLEMVGNPIAFNPDQILIKHAKEKGWEIIIERKDIIVRLDKFVLHKLSG